MRIRTVLFGLSGSTEIYGWHPAKNGRAIIARKACVLLLSET